VHRGIKALDPPMATQTEAYGVPGNAEKPKEGGASVSLFQHAVVLSKNIVAMAVDEPDDGTVRHVSLTQLPTGTELTIVGEGFNGRTVRVCCNDRSYFVFLRDIEEFDSSYYLP
jgi:hypothetical protein